MANAKGAYWRQSALCLATFAIGILVAVTWQNLPGELLPAGQSATHAPNGAVTNATPSDWFVDWPAISLAGVALVLIASTVWFAIARRARQPLAAASDIKQRPTAAESFPATPSRSDIDSARELVEKQLADLVGYVSRYLDDTSDQAAVFATAQTNLAGAATVEQVQGVIKILIANNATARSNADDLRTRLVEAQSETARLQASLAKAEELATVDGLTNLPNRRHFQDRLDNLVATCHREHTPLCLVMADLDHFKGINDKYGHLSGDAVLKTFAQLLTSGVRSTDVAARYGGEEFALILPKTPLGSASVVAESLRRAIAEQTWIGATPKQRIGRVTASFGVAEIRDNETVEALIDRADQKLYEAKHKGRNRVELDHTVTLT